jgi:hypothetical protein
VSDEPEAPCAEIVRHEAARLVAEGYLDQADHGILRPATLP